MRRIMSVMLLALLSLATNANAQGGFSNASLNGTYVFKLNGHNSATVGIPGLALVRQMPGSFTVVAQNFPILTPFGVVGTIVFDGGGNVTGGSGTCLGVGLTESIADDSTSPPTQAFSPEGTRHPIVMQWNALDYIAPEQQRELSGHPTQDGQALPDAEGLWRSNFGPHGRPEYEFVIEYNDVAGNGYRTRFRLFHGGVATLLADERSR